MSSDYDHIVKGPLRLKRKTRRVDEKKNNHNNDKVSMTKAEIEFQNVQEKMLNKSVTKRAMKTHKQRVEEFNLHLDRVTEHFDIPKVSWTK